MKTRNTMDKYSFIIEHLINGVLFWIWYRNLLFKCLPSHNAKESSLILLSIVLAVIIIGIVLESKRQRNGFSVLMNLLLGFGVYTVISYFRIRKSLILVTGAIVCVTSVGWVIFVMCRRIKNRDKKELILKRRLKYSLYSTRNIICLGLGMIILINFINCVFGRIFISPSVPASRKPDSEEWTIKNNIETLAMLRDETWSTLDVEEKLYILQVIANIEQRYLGIPHELQVGADSLDKGLEGYYVDNDHLIMVNLDSLINKSGKELTNTITHEARHAFQYRKVDAYNQVGDELKSLILFSNVEELKENFSNYTNGSKNFCAYYEQECESDAREYAYFATEEYFELIDIYLGGEN